MEKDTGSGVKYYLSLPQEHKGHLARIRHWSNLKAGFETDFIWVKDFDSVQIHSVDVRAIPFKKIYYEKGNQLFEMNHTLPERIVPSLLWTQIDRALPIGMPSLNHNFFGTDERIQISFLQRDAESESVAMIANVTDVSHYVNDAPEIRLQQIRWTMLSGNQVFLVGRPLLSIPGNTYWSCKDQLIPTGYDFELSILSDVIQKVVNPGRDNWVIWNADTASYFLIPKNDVVPLSRSSFRLTLKNDYMSHGRILQVI